MNPSPADTDPAPGERRAAGLVDTVVAPRARDLGGFDVKRALPSARQRTVGPFVFWDQMGPATFAPGHGIDVRPHPHIGLATVTYLFGGEIVHRDSLGTEIAIRPGALNVMTAGRGIVHSERTGGDARRHGSTLWGIQAWVALPRAHEEDEPAFVHHAEATLPVVDADGVRLRLLAGEALGARSPVALPMATLYADAELRPGAVLPVDAAYAERAVYTVDGDVEIGGERFGAGQLLVLRRGEPVTVRGLTSARLMLLGGEPPDAPRHLWWNFVSSRRERIEQAKADWAQRRFDRVPGDDEFIPLPADDQVVSYP